MFYNCLVILLLFSIQLAITEKLQLVHYQNITHISCGLKLLQAKPAKPHNPCLKWHKSSLEEKSELEAIMNGRYADEGEFPYTALIWMSGWFSGGQCTGAVLNEKWIISAAHCFDGWSASDLKIYPGITNYKESYNGYYRADKIIIYEKYDPNKIPEQLYDLALIKLKTNIDFSRNSKVNSVCLPNRDYSHSRTLATLTGWGDVDNDESNEYRIKMTPIVLYEINYDRPFYIISTEIKYGKACAGDSGGPLVQYVDNRAVLIGTAFSAGPSAGGEVCRDVDMIQFAYIPFYIDWIINKMLSN